MPDLLDRCEKCGQMTRMDVGQSWQYERLRWYLSCSCSKCGAAYEMDGIGLPPPEIRQAILAEEGEWELQVLDVAAPKTRIAKSLRTHLDLSLTEAATLIHKIPGVVATGTHAEVQWLAQGLRTDCGHNAVVAKRP